MGSVLDWNTRQDRIQCDLALKSIPGQIGPYRRHLDTVGSDEGVT